MLANFLLAIINVASALLSLYFWVVIISALISWINPDPYNPIVRVIRNLTEPVFQRVRMWLPFTRWGGIDFSPIVVLIAIEFTRMFVIQSLRQIAVGM